MRTDWDTFFMEEAHRWAERSTCARSRVGCIIVKDKRMLGCGFNGPVSGDDHCENPNESCLVEGRCLRAAHAEWNALQDALSKCPEKVVGATAYITMSPCASCFVQLTNAKIKTILFRSVYDNQEHHRIIRGIIERVPHAPYLIRI